MERSFISSQFKRAGDILRKGASEQIVDYRRKFDSIKDIYDSFLQDLIKKDFSFKDVAKTAETFFDSRKVGFAAVDGTEYTRPMFDLVIFFGGSYASKGTIEFGDSELELEYSTTQFSKEGVGISSCVPMYVNEVVEAEQAFMELASGAGLTVARPLTDEMVINNSSIANWIMTFSEFYLAYKLAKDSLGKVRILLMDRSLSNMQSSLVYDTRRRRLWNTCAILGFDVDGVEVDINDLAYNRHRIVNSALHLPPPRGDYLRYSVAYLLENIGPLDLDGICTELSIDSKDRRKRVTRFISRSLKEGYLQENRGIYKVASKYKNSWDRVKGLVESVGRQLFEADSSRNPLQVEKDGAKCWLTTLDMAFLSLFSLYMLVEECWKHRILLLGITKDTVARDFKTHLIPVCLNEKIWSYPLSQEDLDEAPNTDRMLLQYVSIYNYEKLPTPWSLIEYDSAFRMIIPELEKRRPGYASGAIRNRISPERTFLKTYIQLSEARSDPRLRSNVLFMDRLVYPEYDLREDVLVRFKQCYGGAVEPVEAMLYKDRGVVNELQNMIVVMLKAMTNSSIPEVFGHNMPLFIADKVAKWHNSEIRRIVNSTGIWIANNPDLRRFVFYMSTFRERRSGLESGRRET
ncbi:MAG: hypothetical protein L6N96_07065 [Candidatus Methylarchaceae archaeon HK02M2]|nr:hypothetical protein [Candidatus Methylarchaceae archaeon HK02M2]